MIQARFPTIALFALALGIGGAWAPHVSAQTGDTQQQSQQFSDDDLQSYAMALLEVQQIQETYRPQLQGAETPGQQEEVQRKAASEMVQAVRDEGLSVEKYNQIFNATQTDPQVAERVKGYVQDAQ